MSTRWQIVAKLSDNSYGCIYVHCDGYPSYALSTLQEHYTDQVKIDLLIAQGDCISISKSLVNCEPFSSRPDEDWEDIKPTFGTDMYEVANEHRHGDEEYRYGWDGVKWSQIDL